MIRRAAKMRLSGAVGDHVKALVAAEVVLPGERARCIHQTSALLEHRVGQLAVGIDGRACGRHQFALDLVRGQVRLRLQQQRRHAADDRCALRSTGHVVIGVAIMKRGMRLGDPALAIQDAEQTTAGRHNFRLYEALVGRPGSGEGGQTIIGPVTGGSVVGHGAHGNDVGHVPGHTDRHGGGTAVARAGHDHDAGLPGCHDCLIHGVVPVVRLRRRAEGQVQHSNVVLIAVVHNPLDAANDIHVSARTVIIEGFDDHERRVRRNAVGLAAAVRPLSAAAGGNQAGQVRTVAVLVVNLFEIAFLVIDGVVADRPDVAADVFLQPLLAPFIVPEPRVQHRNTHPGAGDALPVEQIGTDHGREAGDPRLFVDALGIGGLIQRLERDCTVGAKAGSQGISILGGLDFIRKFQLELKGLAWLDGPIVLLPFPARCHRCYRRIHLALEQFGTALDLLEFTVAPRPARRKAAEHQVRTALILDFPFDLLVLELPLAKAGQRTACIAACLSVR